MGMACTYYVNCKIVIILLRRSKKFIIQKGATIWNFKMLPSWGLHSVHGWVTFFSKGRVKEEQWFAVPVRNYSSSKLDKWSKLKLAAISDRLKYLISAIIFL